MNNFHFGSTFEITFPRSWDDTWNEYDPNRKVMKSDISKLKIAKAKAKKKKLKKK